MNAILEILRMNASKCYDYSINFLTKDDLKLQCEGNYLLFVCVGTDLTKFEVYEYIASLGLNIIILDNPKSLLAEKLKESNLADIIELDMTCRPSLTDEAMTAIISHLKQHSITLSGVTTLWDDAVGLSARLCRAFDFNGNSTYSVDLAHDKCASRQVMKDNGFSGPLSFKVGSIDEVDQCAALIHYPAIMKPLYGAGSIGVRKVIKREDAVDIYTNIQNTLKETYEQGELMGLTFDDAEDIIHRGEASLHEVVFEEFIEGPEFDCDIVLVDGKTVYCNLIDDWDYKSPHFVELGSTCPSARPMELQNDVKEYANKVLRIMGFETGVFHVEVIYSKRLGPVLIEVNPRMGGGPVRQIHKNIYGVDLADYAICSALGIKGRFSIIESGKVGVTYNLFAYKSGVLTKSIKETLEPIKVYNEIESIIPCGEVGQVVVGWDEGHPTGFGRVNMLIEKEMASRGQEIAEEISNAVAESIRSI